MSDRFTAEQQAAIDAQGRVIVSASAGSGKTTVMIEKIIRLIQSGCSVNEILAVTFTKKAATQMKEKLSKALIEAINRPETTAEKRAYLKKQLSATPGADISTIHSFCANLIRRNFFVADVENTFRIIGGDDAEGSALKHQALDELFEENYEEQDEDFLHLVSVYWRKKSDNKLKEIFIETYNGLRDRADYREYLTSARYDEETFLRVCEDLLKELREKCAYYRSKIEEERSFFLVAGGKGQVALSEELCAGLLELQSAPDYFSACALKKSKYSQNRKPKDADAAFIKHAERLKNWKEKVVEIYDSLALVKSEEEEKGAFFRSGKTARALAKYLLVFDEKYARLKAERGVLDYNDLEHKALFLLKNEEIANGVRGSYQYVFVDEYQDVNPVQEEILSRVGGENLFLVGDVKQAIYGFRGSKSKFFLEKQREFSVTGGKSLIMTRNFRSADEVLTAVNTLFSEVMTLQDTGLDYKTDSYMERGGRYALNSGKVQIHFLEKQEKIASEDRGIYSVKESAKRKAATSENVSAKTMRYIIEEELKKEIYDADLGEYRPVRYSDIAILARKRQGKISETVAALAQEGLPLTSASAVNVCDFAEVKTLIDILSLLNNAEQDVPLCSALLSAMGDMTADELATIRLAYKDETYFRNACKKYAVEKQDRVAMKLGKFFTYFQDLRLRSYVTDAGELLTRILSETRMESAFLSRRGGVACLKRIRRFIEESSNPEPLSVHGFLEKLRNLDYKIEYNENGGDDSVRVMTMHASKGLEYPIVIVDNLSQKFKRGDSDEVFAEERYGLAPNAYDEARALQQTTLLRRLHEVKKNRSSIMDELNLYYVALTRAKHTLHLLVEKTSSATDVRYATSFADFTDFDLWKNYIVEDEIFDVPKQERQMLAYHPDERTTQEIIRAFLWQYPFAGFENLPVKSSATALLSDGAVREKQLAFSEDSTAELFDDDLPENVTDRELGIAYHAFLERFDFSLLYDQNGLPVGKEELWDIAETAFGKMIKEGVDLTGVTTGRLTEILSNPIFYKLQDMQLYKEQKFLVSLPVKDTYAKKRDANVPADEKTSGEEMLFQGAIDLLAIGEDIQIVDYKYSKRDAEYLREHYKSQLDLYRLAVSRITKVPLDRIRCVIVNIRSGFQVDMD